MMIKIFTFFPWKRKKKERNFKKSPPYFRILFSLKNFYTSLYEYLAKNTLSSVSNEYKTTTTIWHISNICAFKTNYSIFRLIFLTTQLPRQQLNRKTTNSAFSSSLKPISCLRQVSTGVLFSLIKAQWPVERGTRELKHDICIDELTS